MNLSVKVRGLDRVIANVSALNGKLLVGVAEDIKQTGEEIAVDAKGSLSKGHGVDTGAYQKSIKSKFNESAPSARIAGWHKGRPHPLGHLIELGTDPHDIGDNGGKHPGTDPIPHLEPAFQKGAASLEGRLKNTIRRLA